MSIPLLGFAFYDDGSPLTGATVEVYDQTPTLIATDTSTSDGMWAFDDAQTPTHQGSLADGKVYDVKVINLGIVRWIKGAEKHQTASVVYFPVPYQDFIRQSSDPASPLTGDSRLFVRTADGRVYLKDDSGIVKPVGIAEFEELTFGRVTVSTNYTVAADISDVFVSANSITVTLDAPSATATAVTVHNYGSGTVTMAATSGSFFGGSVNTSDGTILNGTVSPGDSITWVPDGTNWRV